jgi:hypothetical protein
MDQIETKFNAFYLNNFLTADRFYHYDGIRILIKLSQPADVLVREKVALTALTHVKQQQCICLELSNAFDV